MIKRLLWDDDAQAITEYVLIMTMIALLIIASLLEITGGIVSTFYTSIVEVLAN